MTSESSVQGEVARERVRCAFFYGIDGDLRFIAHQDTLRVFHRMLARAELPVRFSSGFNPHPRVSIVLPRPVGIASDDEAVVVEWERPVDPAEALSRLSRQCPTGLHMHEARRLAPDERLRAASVRYRFTLEERPGIDLSERVARIMAGDAEPVERRIYKSGTTRMVDIRPYILDISVTDDAVNYTLRVTDGGSARPAEIPGLLGFGVEPLNHRIRRMETLWKSNQ